MNEKYILVSLDDEKSKKLANIVSNDTCRKILDYLSEKDASETDISTALNIPLSTTHYNIQNLYSNGLVEIKDFFWSDKGNKINVYRIAKKYIIIAPKGRIIASNLRDMMPVALITAATSAFIYIFAGFRKITVSSDLFGQQALQPIATSLMQESAKSAAAGSQATVASALANATAADISTSTIVQSVNVPIPEFNFLWFLAGSMFAIFLYIMISNIRRKK